MKTKLTALFSSIRFYQLLIVAALQILVALNVISSDQGISITNILSGFLIAVTAVGTIDKATAKSAPKKKK